MSDNFGNRMKMYERQEAGRRFMPLLPVYARIDGRSFSKFTKDMQRPYDANMSRCMIETTKYLAEQTNAKIGYTQSDEISLVFYSDSVNSQIFFDGKIQKMVSVLAAMATSKFVFEAMKYWPGLIKHKLPVFDCRVFTLPNLIEAANAILWREQDATKNAISMAARSMFTHKELQGKSGSDMQEMMFQRGINFNDYPAFFKRGTFIQKVQVPQKMTSLHTGKEITVLRHVMSEIEMPTFSKVTNRVDVIFNGAKSIVEEA